MYVAACAVCVRVLSLSYLAAFASAADHSMSIAGRLLGCVLRHVGQYICLSTYLNMAMRREGEQHTSSHDRVVHACVRHTLHYTLKWGSHESPITWGTLYRFVS